MDKNKHTPGPWSVWTSCSWRRICSADGRSVCIPVVQRHDNHPDLHFPNGGEGGPDARLMTAAPDLLAALRLAVAHGGHMDDCSREDPSGRPCDCWFSRALAALAKARGEA